MTSLAKFKGAAELWGNFARPTVIMRSTVQFNKDTKDTKKTRSEWLLLNWALQHGEGKSCRQVADNITTPFLGDTFCELGQLLSGQKYPPTR